MAAMGIPPIEFSAARRAHYEALCDDLIDRALDAHDAFHGSATLDAWKLVRQKDALSVYKLAARPPPAARAKSDAPAARTQVLLGSGAIPGTVDDAIIGMFADSTESLRISRSILSDKFIDGAVVHVFEANPPSASIVFSGIKWIALKAPVGGQIIRDRDLLTYERQGRIIDRHGQFFAYHVYQSIDLPEWPARRDGSGSLTRAYMAMCYLYRPLSARLVGCFMLGDFHPGGAVPAALGEFVAADRMLSVGHFLRSALAKRFSALAARGADRLRTDSSHCDLCLRPAARILHGGPQWCAGCGRRTCRRCRERRVVFRLGLRTRRPEKEIFCRDCVDRVVGHRVDRSDRGEDPITASSSGSSGGVPSPHADGWASATDDEDDDSSKSAHGVDADTVAGFHRAAERINWNAAELVNISARLTAMAKGCGRSPARRRSSGDAHRRASAAPPLYPSNRHQSNPTAMGEDHREYRRRQQADEYFQQQPVETPADPRGRSPSLLFDQERQQYIRVFDRSSSSAAPPPVHRPRPQADPLNVQPPTHHRRHHRSKDAVARLHTMDGGGRRDQIFDVDALD